ncbi:hypothetical protein QF035_009229 [Streptomyces umbrinus]|uniref:Uncharacterized protein n=1 Tax=Streptomyces umbrinus TaxID=67370 RepID=A0ABU0T7L8_9ACTN|nr:hypothetical protein [Streptomyces umbrinus]
MFRALRRVCAPRRTPEMKRPSQLLPPMHDRPIPWPVCATGRSAPARHPTWPERGPDRPAPPRVAFWASSGSVLPRRRRAVRSSRFSSNRPPGPNTLRDSDAPKEPVPLHPGPPHRTQLPGPIQQIAVPSRGGWELASGEPRPHGGEHHSHMLIPVRVHSENRLPHGLATARTRDKRRTRHARWVHSRSPRKHGLLASFSVRCPAHIEPGWPGAPPFCGGRRGPQGRDS